MVPGLQASPRPMPGSSSAARASLFPWNGSPTPKPKPKTHCGPSFPSKGSSTPHLMSPQSHFANQKGQNAPTCPSSNSALALTVYRVLSCILHVLNPEKGAVGTVVMFFTDEETKAHRELPGSHRDTPEGWCPQRSRFRTGSQLCWSISSKYTPNETNFTNPTVLML